MTVNSIPTWAITGVLGLMTIVTIISTSSISTQQNNSCHAFLASNTTQTFTLILTADSGKFAGVSEAEYIILAMGNTAKAVPPQHKSCQQIIGGIIHDQNVFVVTTGIGPVSAALCTHHFMLACSKHVRELVFFGTSGWSPQMGGVIDSKRGCNDTIHSRKPIARIGDVCITPMAVNWDCKKSSWSQQAAGYPNVCTHLAEDSSPVNESLHGMCLFGSPLPSSLALANKILTLAKTTIYPERPTSIQHAEMLYWNAMANGTGNTFFYNTTQQPITPSVYGYRECVEVDSQFMYSGAPWDQVAREYAAMAIGQGVGSTDVFAVAAMEAIGFAEAMIQFPRIPFTNIRVASNMNHGYLIQKEKGHVFEVPPNIDMSDGYKYAIQTGSQIILQMFASRRGSIRDHFQQI